MKDIINILVVEDDDLFRKTLIKALKKEDYEAEGAANGKEAIELCKAKEFDLVVSDVRLPGEFDGIETLNRIKKLKAGSGRLAIIITGFADSDAANRAVKIGAEDYLYKPFEIDVFLQCVKKCLLLKADIITNMNVAHRPTTEKLDYSFLAINLEADFINVVEELYHYLSGVKDMCDKKEVDNKADYVSFIKGNKARIFEKLDVLFESVWDLAKDYEKPIYRIHQQYFIQRLNPLLCDLVDIVKYIRERPLGYCGDFVTMNYIFDYHKDRYLGKTLYSKLMNNYVCNIDVSRSNIGRKEYIKGQIIQQEAKKEDSKILSIGCGSAREIIELLIENKLTTPLEISLLDFEKKAVDYIKEQLKNMPFDKSRVRIELLHRDVLKLVKNNELKSLGRFDFIYVSGVFDYLSQKVCMFIIKEFFSMLNRKGALLVCNLSKENERHRAYYEMFAEWEMIHRTRKEIMEWMQGNIKDYDYDLSMEDGSNNYYFLNIYKK